MSLYILSLLATIFTLSLWHVLHKGVFSSLSSTLFYMCLIGYGLSAINLFMLDQISAPVILRDIFVIAAISTFFMFVKENLIISIAGLFMLGSAMPTLYQYLKEQQTKPTPSPIETKSTPTPIEEAFLDGTFDEEISLEIDKNGELLLEINQGFSIADLNELKETYGLKISKAFDPIKVNQTDLDDYFLLDISHEHEKDIALIIKTLQSKRAVEWVERNEVMYYEPIESITDVIAPPIKKYAVNDPLVSEKWEYAALQFDKFYTYIKDQKIKPRKKAKLFILDTGVDGEHEDLKKQFRAFDKNSSKDDVGHGTHCAGIAAAVSNNKLGVNSPVPNSRFVEVSGIKVLSGFGFGTQKMIIDGMIKAIDAGADVISMSLGGKSTEAREKAYNEVVDYARLHNVIIITAAGNSAKDASLFCPANSAGVIAVAAVGQDLKRTSFSNTLQHIKYGVSAPGKDILSTYPNNEYKTYSGTSMAAPYVSGLVSVLRSVKPELSPDEAFRILHSTGKITADPFKTGHMIQPFEAIKLLNEEMLN